MNSPLRFTYPLSASFRGVEIELDADLTFVPPSKAGNRVLRDASCVVHGATLSEDNDYDAPRPGADTLRLIAQDAANAAIEAIAAEAGGRLEIERDLAENKAALSNRPINAPLIRPSTPEARLEHALAALG